MMSVKEVKKLRQNAQSGKAFALSRGNDFNYRLHCKVERILNQILGEDASDPRYKKKPREFKL